MKPLPISRPTNIDQKFISSDFSNNQREKPWPELKIDPGTGELDESEIHDIDDIHWDVFLLDDDSELMPERTDFWIPD